MTDKEYIATLQTHLEEQEDFLTHSCHPETRKIYEKKIQALKEAISAIEAVPRLKKEILELRQVVMRG